MERRNLVVVFIVGVVAALIGAWIGMTTGNHLAPATVNAPLETSAAPPAPPVEAPGMEGMTSLAPVLKRALPGVVNISASGGMSTQSNPLFSDPLFRRFFEPFGLPFGKKNPSAEPIQSIGSGVIVDAKDGYVLTNEHLVNKADVIYVVLQDKRKVKATVIGGDPDMDIAVLQIHEKNLSALPLGDSDALQAGDFVMAIGNPFALGTTATFGIVSALGRTGLGIEGYEDFIQTDAAVNPGNSGGALINLKGELIGINTAIVSSGNGSVGIGFAIPINLARQVMNELITHGGKIDRGQLGIEVQELTPDIRDALNVDVNNGAIVTRVLPDSAAAKAGIETGDVIVRVDGKKVSSGSSLRMMVGLKSVGDKVDIELIRKGEHTHLTAVVGRPAVSGESEVQGTDLLKGATFTTLPAGGKARGALVVKVAPDSPAAFAGLQAGDIILAVNQQPIASVEDLLKAASAHKDRLLLHVQRGDMALFIVIG